MPQCIGPVLMVGSSVACAKALRWTLTSGQGDNCKLLHTVSGRPCSSIGANPPTVDDYLHFLYHSRPNEKREKNIK
ncbi:hypothetical protein T4E_3499 [Trichinella pseudospiralis]|uniref:Uncharacterized protein n=1 Tax=Trichinella pseudospiralis TaxID=6337 RepID=A0A0V0XMW7_TRIPS|nr:hypothetical protein T4E_3499 [Trichinella pseudospiralis]